MAVHMRLTRVGGKKNPIYRVVVADSRSPRDGQVPRDHRALQPADRALDDRVRRGKGEGVAWQGRTAVAGGLPPAEGQEHWLSCSSTWPGNWWDDPDAVQVDGGRGRLRRPRPPPARRRGGHREGDWPPGPCRARAADGHSAPGRGRGGPPRADRDRMRVAAFVRRPRDAVGAQGGARRRGRRGSGRGSFYGGDLDWGPYPGQGRSSSCAP